MWYLHVFGIALSLALAINPITSEAGPSKAIIGFPTLGSGELSKDIYLYACSDSSCQDIIQLPDYGHITNVAPWPKPNGPGGTPPQSWIFLNLLAETDHYYQFWQKYQGNWESCIFQITPTGTIGSGTTCVGVVSVPPPQGVTGNLPFFNMGTAMFSGSTPTPTGPTPNQRNQVPATRSISYVNQTSDYTVCLQTDSSFNHPQCKGGIRIAQGNSKAIPVPANQGINSGLGQIAAIKPTQSSNWINSGLATQPQAQVQRFHHQSVT